MYKTGHKQKHETGHKTGHKQKHKKKHKKMGQCLWEPSPKKIYPKISLTKCHDRLTCPIKTFKKDQ